MSATVSATPVTIAEALRAPGVEPIDARLLLQHVLGLGHASLLAHAERRLNDDERDRFLALLARRAQGEPVAYLVGWREFYGRRFKVDRSVLIPRPETELLVDLTLQRILPNAHARVLDLGTGSGNIALTLACERAHCTITAIDASPAALALAQDNALALEASTIRWLEGDWFTPVAGCRFDLIVSNPPYVALTDPHLERGDLRFEPPSALRAGPDGLASIRAIAAQASAYLRPSGWLLLEHGHDQGDACRGILHAGGFVNVMTACDLAQLPRVSAGRRSSS